MPATTETTTRTEPHLNLDRLESLGVKRLDSDHRSIDQKFLSGIGFLNPGEQVSQITPVTDYFFSTKDAGGGWHRGGAESFYYVLRVQTNQQDQPRHLALKAIHSMGGDIANKTKAEATRLALLSKMGLAPRVYAASQGTIYRDWLPQDDQPLTKEDRQVQLEHISAVLGDLGITPLNKDGVASMTTQHQGKLIITDGGSGDLSGP